MASVPCNNSELEGLETAEGEQRNGADPDHEHRERAQIAVEPKRSLYAHERPPILPIEPLRPRPDRRSRLSVIGRRGGWIGSNAGVELLPAVPFRGVAVTARGALRKCDRMGKDGRHVHAAPPRNAHFCPPYSATAILNWVAVRAMVRRMRPMGCASRARWPAVIETRRSPHAASSHTISSDECAVTALVHAATLFGGVGPGVAGARPDQDRVPGAAHRGGGDRRC